jgi:molecular chaperone GrpE
LSDENAAAKGPGDESVAGAKAGETAAGDGDRAAGESVGGDAVQDEIEALRRQVEEHRNQYLRAVAEMDNLRKRNARELENARKFGAERLVAAILPVRDSLEAGLKAAEQADSTSPEVGALLEGEQATLRLLDQALEAAGIEEIDPEGEPFDPERHEAMSMLPSDSAEPNSVIAVIQKGYSLHERIVRPARVVVSMAPATPDRGTNE